MTSNEVKAMVDKSLSKYMGYKNDYGCIVSKCLITPEKLLFVDVDNSEVELWDILEEDPEKRDGYMVVYDEKEKLYGIAIHSVLKELIALEFYKSFLEAFESME